MPVANEVRAEAARDRRIRRHIANLDRATDDDTVALRSEGYLIRIYGVRALVPLLEACRHINPTVRFRAVWALAHTHDPRAYETILALVDDPDERVHYDATLALGILGDPRANEPLTRLFYREDVTRPAGEAIARMGLSALTALQEILRDGTSEQRVWVVRTLGKLAEATGDERCLRLLESCRNDSAPEVQTEAASLLEQYSSK